MNNSVRRSRRKSSFIVDTPESNNGNQSIVEDSVFDNSQVSLIVIDKNCSNIALQVPDTVERSRRVEPPGTSKPHRVRSKGRNLPSVLPGEETFVTQSQQVALSSTLAEVNKSMDWSRTGCSSLLIYSLSSFV